MYSDEEYMKEAISLARKGRGGASPNPMVGALLVKRGQIVGRGYHRKAGEAHAEVNAISDAGEAARGATIYLNLEPCCHFGKTPPCTDALIKSGVKKVVASMTDPNPKVSGRGFEILKRAGIEVETGLLEAEARRLNEGFIMRVIERRPFVTLKIAASLDGKISTRTGESKWITSERSRREVHRVRAQSDAIMTGAGTVVADDPLLTPREVRTKKLPLRIVVDSTLRVPHTARLACEGTIFFTTEKRSPSSKKNIEAKGAEVIETGSLEGKVDLAAAMREIGKRGVNYLLVEAGSELAGSLIGMGLVDRIIFFYAPVIIGGSKAAGMVGGDGISSLSDALSMRDIRIRRFDRDIMVEGYVHRNN